MRLRLAILALVISSLACMEQVSTVTPAFTPQATAADPIPSPAPTATPRPSPTATVPAEDTAVVVQALVNLRDAPDGTVIGSLEAGQAVTVIQCDADWCEVETKQMSGFVYRGCISDNPEELGCTAK